MVHALRIFGWLIFGSGLTFFLMNGGVSNVRDRLSMIALILMPVGMVFTSSATILAWRRNMKRMAEEVRRRREPPAPPPPAPAGPEKHYGARKLDPGKLEKKPDDAP